MVPASRQARPAGRVDHWQSYSPTVQYIEPEPPYKTEFPISNGGFSFSLFSTISKKLRSVSSSLVSTSQRRFSVPAKPQHQTKPAIQSLPPQGFTAILDFQTPPKSVPRKPVPTHLATVAEVRPAKKNADRNPQSPLLTIPYQTEPILPPESKGSLNRHYVQRKDSVLSVISPVRQPLTKPVRDPNYGGGYERKEESEHTGLSHRLSMLSVISEDCPAPPLPRKSSRRQSITSYYDYTTSRINEL
jgi:hypothetical protein